MEVVRPWRCSCKGRLPRSNIICSWGGGVQAIHFCTRASRLPPALTRENFWQSTGSTTSRLLGEDVFLIFLAHTNEISDESFRIPGADHYCSDIVNSGGLCAFALPPGEQQAALDAYAKPARAEEVTAEEDEIMAEVIQCFRNDPENEEEVEPAMEEIEKRQRQRRRKQIQHAKEKGKRVRAARRAKARARAKAKAKASGPSPPPPPVGPGAPSPAPSPPPPMPPVVGPSAPSEADGDAEPPPKKRHVNPAKVGRSGSEWSIFRFAPFQRTSVGVICGKKHRTVVCWPPAQHMIFKINCFPRGVRG